MLARLSGSLRVLRLRSDDVYQVSMRGVVVLRGLGVVALLAGVLVVPGSALAATADLQVTSSSSTSQVGEEGSSFTHTITVTNVGPDTATSATAHLDTEPLTWGVGVVSASGSGASLGTVNFDAALHTVDATANNLPSGGTLRLQVSVSPSHPGIQTTTGNLTASSPSDANPANNSASTTTTVTGLPRSDAHRRRELHVRRAFRSERSRWPHGCRDGCANVRGGGSGQRTSVGKRHRSAVAARSARAGQDATVDHDQRPAAYHHAEEAAQERDPFHGESE